MTEPTAATEPTPTTEPVVVTEPAAATERIRVVAVGDDAVPAELAADQRFAITMIDPFRPDQPLTGAALAAQVLLSDVAPANVGQMAELRWLQLGSAGYQQLAGHDLAGRRLAGREVVVTNASGVNDIPIAEWCVLMMMTLLRDLPQILRDQREGHYRRPARYQRELRGRRLGILGYGGIGRELARQSLALGLRVKVMNRSPIGPAPLRYAPAGTGDPDGSLPVEPFALGNWAPFLADLDFLALTVALNTRTQAMIGAEQLKLLPPQAFLLNPARAQLVDETALRVALESGTPAGAALDSHYREPLVADDPTWSLPNTVVTPHISGSTGSPQYRPRLWDLFGANLRRFAAGDPLLNVVPAADLPA